MDATTPVIFKHRQNHAADQTVSGGSPGRQYYVDADTMLLHRLIGRLKKVAAEPGVVHPDDIAEFRQFPKTFREVKPAAPAATPPAPPAPPSPVQGTGKQEPEGGADPAPPSPPVTIDALLGGSVSNLKKALESGAADHLDFRALAAAERAGKDRSTALAAILARKQDIAQAAAEAAQT